MTMFFPCTDGKGERQNHEAEGWLCSPEGRRIVAMCRHHADVVIQEYAEKLQQHWTFESWAGDAGSWPPVAVRGRARPALQLLRYRWGETDGR